MRRVVTLGSGTKSGPSGILMLVRVDSTFHTPRNSSGKYRSAGPPPILSHALSTAGGSLLACMHCRLLPLSCRFWQTAHTWDQ